MPKAPTLPNYSGIVTAIRKSAKKDRALAQQQLHWARRMYKNANKINKDVVSNLQEVMDFQLQNAKDDRARYEGVYQPLEDEQMAEIDKFQQRATDFDAEVAKLKEEATQFKSEANQKYMAGKAQSGVQQAFAAKKQETERALLDQGVNPNSGAAVSMTAGLNLAEGAAEAAAGTQAADAARTEGDVKYQAALDRQIQAGSMAATGLQLQENMVKVGQTYPGAVATEAGQVGTAGAQAVDSTVAVQDEATRARALAASYRQINAAELGTWSDTLTNDARNRIGLYSAQVQEEQVKQQESSGIGGILGIVGGIAKSFLPGFEEGGMVEEGYADGGGVGDPGVSTDVVPARLTPGEFVVPDHVVRWKGEEYFQKMIDKAPKEKKALVTQTGAQAAPIPTRAPAPQGALTI